MEIMKLIVPKIAEYSNTVADHQKISNKSLENMHQLFQIYETNQNFFDSRIDDDSPKSEKVATLEEDRSIRFWLPLLYGYLDIVMNGELEVRTR